MSHATYILGFGSNRHSRYGAPEAAVARAIATVGGVIRQSRVIASAAIGPSRRRFANAVAVIESDEPPPVLLARIKGIERAMGRRRGVRWGARVIDIDILLWSGGRWRSRTLTVPHIAIWGRGFVLRPLVEVAPGWRDPVSGRTVRQLACRASSRKVDPTRPRA